MVRAFVIGQQMMTDLDDINDFAYMILGLRHPFSLRYQFAHFNRCHPAIHLSPTILMRLPSISTIVRTLYTFSNATRFQTPHRGLSPFIRGSAIKSMPTIPFLGSLFSSSSSSAKMTYPDQRSDQEWQAVLNKGQNLFHPYPTEFPPVDVWSQSNSGSCERKAPKPPAQASTTSICLMRVSTPALAAMRRYTKQTTSSSLVAAGRHTTTPSLAQSLDIQTARLVCRGQKLSAATVEVILVMSSKEKDTQRQRTKDTVSTASV
jgi:hypothetical protein